MQSALLPIIFLLLLVLVVFMAAKRRMYNSLSRQIIHDVLNYLRFHGNGEGVRKAALMNEAKKAMPTVSLQVIRSVNQGNLSTPTKAGKSGRKAQYVMDDFALGVVRRCVIQLYSENIWPTLDDIRKALHTRFPEEFPRRPSTGTVHRMLKLLGFKYQTFDSRKYILERGDIKGARTRYLRSIRETQNAGIPIVYLDETWFSENGCVSKIWEAEDPDFKNLLLHKRLPKSGRGKRVIILHAGGRLGWVNGAALTFVCDGTKADYHDNMTGDRFWLWFKEQLLPNLQPNTCIVMDNAPYHSMYGDDVPKSTSRKAAYQEWLHAKGISYPENATRDELWRFYVKPAKDSSQSFKIDILAAQSGHNILHLPPYHCDLNPIELVWSYVKKHLAKNNPQPLRNIPDAAKVIMASVTPEMWQKYCDHVVRIENEYWAKDVVVDLHVESVVINLAEDTESDKYSESDSSNNEAASE
jgi:transposase